MASVNSLPRKILKPFIKGLLGDTAYEWFQVRAKLRDIKYRLVEEPEMELLPFIVKPGDHVLDIGANYGYYTSRLSVLCGPGKVYAFEPIPSTFVTLSEIVRKLDLGNVELFRAGISNESGSVEFDLPIQEVGTPSAGQAHISTRNNDMPGKESHYAFKRSIKVRCPVFALDDESWRLKMSKVAFIKIDVEGAEFMALLGMKKMLVENKPVVLLEICPFFLKGFGIGVPELRALFELLGYNVYAYLPEARKLFPYVQLDFVDGNYFLIHQTKVAQYSHLFL